MLKNQTNVREFMQAIGQTVRSTPSIPTAEEARLSVILLLEEVLEFAEAAGVKISIVDSFRPITHTGDFSFDFNLDKVNLVEMADAVGDIDYINNGVANRCGFDLEILHNEINDSNFTKVDNGYKREDGKWVKGPNYRPANIKLALEKHETPN